MKGLTTYKITLKELIKRCKNKDPKAERLIYERLSPILLGICRRYLKDFAEAEDAMVESMFKVFTKLEQHREKSSFEGWCKKIAVNECLMRLRKKKNFNLSIDSVVLPKEYAIHSLQQLEADDILAVLEKLPTGYRTVFNLYVIEGYKHREIAEKLGISINTSKSQLILAKKRLQLYLKNMQYPDIAL